MARTAPATGPVFRPIDRHGRLGPGRLSGQAVAAVVKRAALAAGLDPSFFAGHSLRAGHVTQAKRNDASDLEVMSQTIADQPSRSRAMCGRPTCSATPRPGGWSCRPGDRAGVPLPFGRTVRLRRELLAATAGSGATGQGAVLLHVPHVIDQAAGSRVTRWPSFSS
jgi:hypothetical protein